MGWKTLGLKEAIKEMLHDSGMTQKGVCEAAGYKSVGSVAQPLARGDIKISSNLEGYSPIKIKPNDKKEES